MRRAGTTARLLQDAVCTGLVLAMVLLMQLLPRHVPLKPSKDPLWTLLPSVSSLHLALATLLLVAFKPQAAEMWERVVLAVLPLSAPCLKAARQRGASAACVSAARCQHGAGYTAGHSRQCLQVAQRGGPAPGWGRDQW